MMPIGVIERQGHNVSLLLTSSSLPYIAHLFSVPARRTVLLSTFFLAPRNTPDFDLSLALLTNLFGTLESLGLGKNLICACGPYEDCSAAWSRRFPVFLTQRNFSNLTVGPVLSALVIKLKWLLASQFLRHSYNVLYLDWDVGIIRPFFHLIDNVQHDFISLSDTVSGANFFKRETLPMHKRFSCGINYGDANPCASTGLWHVMAMKETAEFTNDVWNVSMERTETWEQAVFNQLAPHWRNPLPFGPKRQINFQIFPIPEVINVPLLFELPQEQFDHTRVTMLHCGYLHGLGDKINALRRGFNGTSFFKEVYAGEDVHLVDHAVHASVGAGGL
ncbi:hypothetical protein TSOC_005105 [Tetrabaena socialis]|uniref:Nucleotide-diphospho-sugar transferase domain-containing protein n=1 Tax=Tetrabaena socialis TaxID=47790 RepID=A0A2J7ZR16_9CHLO|nr:hypothetical protein TSOC_011299 [Tetrabaena socialis]PNH08359.1 hypothetical protein TSOC_005105 [Tetrabaena socialis]|eukprot:PNH02708.1 hypothetical protein TSOC_011299 [Tetrabaena socialis]